MRKAFSCENTLTGVVALMGEALEFLTAQQLSSRSLFLAELAMEEMLTNTVKYGFDDDGAHRLEVSAEVEAGQVRLELRDDGHPFDPSQAATPKPGGPLSTRALGGSGILLMRRMMDRFEYRREGNQNVVTLGFPIAVADPTASG